MPLSELWQIVWAAYWAGECARELGLVQVWQRGQTEAIYEIARSLWTLAPMLERQQTLRARRVAAELARLF